MAISETARQLEQANAAQARLIERLEAELAEAEERHEFVAKQWAEAYEKARELGGKLAEAQRKIDALERQGRLFEEECACLPADWGVEEYVTHLEAKLAEAHRTIKRARNGVKAVRELIDCSHGVDGLHMNGDIAYWDELEGGGQYEEWLAPFNVAEAALGED